MFGMWGNPAPANQCCILWLIQVLAAFLKNMKELKFLVHSFILKLLSQMLMVWLHPWATSSDLLFLFLPPY